MTTRVRLAVVLADCDFRYGPITLWDMARQDKRFPKRFSDGDVALMISKSRDQLLWVTTPTELDSHQGSRHYKIFDTRRMYIQGGTWHPWMLREYANEIGLDVVNVKSFEQQLEESRKRHREHERALRAASALVPAALAPVP